MVASRSSEDEPSSRGRDAGVWVSSEGGGTGSGISSVSGGTWGRTSSDRRKSFISTSFKPYLMKRFLALSRGTDSGEREITSDRPVFLTSCDVEGKSAVQVALDAEADESVPCGTGFAPVGSSTIF